MIVDEITKFLPDAKIDYKDKSYETDPRNYKVNFSKVRNILGFVPKHSVKDGITELLKFLGNKKFHDVEKNKNFYGNYEIKY